MKVNPNLSPEQSTSGKLNQNKNHSERSLNSKYIAGEQSILVIGGHTEYKSQNLHPTIILVNDNGQMKVEESGNRGDFKKIDKALGHFLDGNLVICPQSAKDCTIIENDGTRKIEMNVRRSNKALVNLNDSTMWITGGNTREMSTEFISLNGSKKGDNLPFGIEYHCMVKYNPKHILMIGGNYRMQGGKNVVATSKTWIIDTEQNFNITEGPQLNQGRNFHYCGKIKDAFGNVLIVVISGKKSLSTRWVGKRQTYFFFIC